MADLQDIAAPRSTREGWDAPVANDAERRASIEAAFDYRGDVTIQTRDGRTLAGYIYDRRLEDDPPVLRMMLATGGREILPFDDVARLTFTGRDTAAGLSWETWTRKYAEKAAKQQGSQPGNPVEDA